MRRILNVAEEKNEELATLKELLKILDAVRNINETVRVEYFDSMNCDDERQAENCLMIKDVIFNKPATIVKWCDGTKTVVKCQNGEPFDKEKGLALAFIKKMYGNTGRYNEIFHYWCDEESEQIETKHDECDVEPLAEDVQLLNEAVE